MSESPSWSASSVWDPLSTEVIVPLFTSRIRSRAANAWSSARDTWYSTGQLLNPSHYPPPSVNHRKLMAPPVLVCGAVVGAAAVAWSIWYAIRDRKNRRGRHRSRPKAEFSDIKIRSTGSQENCSVAKPEGSTDVGECSRQLASPSPRSQAICTDLYVSLADYRKAGLQDGDCIRRLEGNFDVDVRVTTVDDKYVVICFIGSSSNIARAKQFLNSFLHTASRPSSRSSSPAREAEPIPVTTDPENVLKDANDANEHDEVLRTVQLIMSYESPHLFIGEPAPKFTAAAILNGDFIDIELDSYKGKYLCLVFYPADFSFVCPTELIAFSDKIEEFKKLECEVLAASCDSQYSHLAWYNTPRRQGGLGGNVKFPMLADHNAEIAKRYGTYCNKEGNAYRGLFIIDRDQNLRHLAISDMPVGRSVEETLRLIQAFQYTDENGVVCPANWAPGQDTLHADPEKSKEYFARKHGQ